MIILAQLLMTVYVMADSHPESFVLCKLNGNARTLRVEVDEQKICHTVYSKSGVEKEIATGRNKESCLRVLQNVQENLEKSHWGCHAATAATVSQIGN